MKKTEWKRKCPKCDEEILYSRKYERDRAEKRNTNCGLCVLRSEKVRKRLSDVNKGKNNPMYGRSVYSIWLEKYGKEKADKRQKETNSKMTESHKGKKRKPFTEDARKNMSNSHKGQVPWNKGKTGVYSEEALKNFRLSALKRIGQIMPNHNSGACKIINDYNKKYNYNFRHAENGGEVCVDGYWPDGLDEERKTIIEIDEKHHFDNSGKLRQKDIRRQRYLEGLGYKFIRIKF